MKFAKDVESYRTWLVQQDAVASFLDDFNVQTMQASMQIDGSGAREIIVSTEAAFPAAVEAAILFSKYGPRGARMDAFPQPVCEWVSWFYARFYVRNESVWPWSRRRALCGLGLGCISSTS